MSEKDPYYDLKDIDRRILRLLMKRFEFLLLNKNRDMDLSCDFPSVSVQKVLTKDFLKKLSLIIHEESERLLSREYPLIAFQGEHGAFSEMVAHLWAPDLIPIPCQKFSEIFDGVSKGIFSLGVIPVENNTGGVVNQANRYFLSTRIHVVGAVELPVHHCLMAPPGVKFEELRVVYSHTQALEQCRGFINQYNLEQRPFFDTAGAAKMIGEQKPPSCGAIAGKLAAELYNLDILRTNIEDFSNNFTRFLIISASPGKGKGEKCSILFSTAHKAGTLFRVLEIFARKNINLTRIESIPNQKGGFAFFLDFIGSLEDKTVKDALNEVSEITHDYHFLGNYEEITANDDKY